MEYRGIRRRKERGRKRIGKQASLDKRIGFEIVCDCHYLELDKTDHHI